MNWRKHKAFHILCQLQILSLFSQGFCKEGFVWHRTRQHWQQRIIIITPCKLRPRVTCHVSSTSGDAGETFQWIVSGAILCMKLRQNIVKFRYFWKQQNTHSGGKSLHQPQSRKVRSEDNLLFCFYPAVTWIQRNRLLFYPLEMFKWNWVEDVINSRQSKISWYLTFLPVGLAAWLWRPTCVTEGPAARAPPGPPGPPRPRKGGKPAWR